MRSSDRRYIEGYGGFHFWFLWIQRWKWGFLSGIGETRVLGFFTVNFATELHWNFGVST